MASNAQTKMKALVVSRLLLGDINDWPTFERERNTAGKIANRHAARSVSAQIGRSYKELSNETQRFITSNFARCSYEDLARLCDAVKPGIGLYLQLDEFEESNFPLAESVKRRFPVYAHVAISTYGLQFEFPEHHFMNDLHAAFEDLKETRKRIDELGITETNMKDKRDEITLLVSREKFISRSMVSTAFSLVETFLSGLFFTALKRNSLGNLRCDQGFLSYAKNKERAALKDRIDHVVRFASQDQEDGESNPFRPFIEIGKYFRDAIHHTTPFERRNIEAGQRLEALYNVKCDVAIVCALLALDTVLRISFWLFGAEDESEITATCKPLREEIFIYSVEQGIARPS